jgi:beta-lactam-binding protein with PASTA domain
MSRVILIASALIVASRAIAAQTPGPVIPNVVGQTEQAARATLAPTKLPVVSLDTVIAGKPGGVVVAQRPGPGTLVARAKEVAILVTRPPRRLPPSVFTTPRGSILLPPTRVDTPVPPTRVPRDTVVPDLFGRTPNAVAAALEMNRLRLGTVTSDSSDLMRAGYAFAQNPQPGTRVALGTAVNVVYSLGPHQRVATATVPLIETRTIPEALVVLKRANLQLGRIDTLYQLNGDGRIAHQEPHAGTIVHPLDAVAATIALPIRLIPAPNVVGMTRDQARAAIEGVGLNVGVIGVIARPGARVAIDSQRPPAGTGLTPGSRIDLVEVQPATAPTQVVVPSLTGMTEAEAARRLAADSLSLGRVVRPSDDSAAKIVAQQPGAGQTVLVHSLVAIRLAARLTPSPQPVDTFVTVPSVVNTTVDAARDKARDAGFAGMRVTGDVATGGAVVTTQTPPAGVLVRPSTVITVRAETTIVRSVPDLVGRTEDGARSEASQDQFLLTVNNRYRRLTWREAVTSQTPPAGAPAPGNRTIGVDLAIPVVPPVPAAIALGFIGATEEVVRRWRRRRHRQFAFDVQIPPPDVPHLLSSGGDRLIRSTVEFHYELGAPTWNVTAPGATLIKAEKVRNA